MKQDRKSQSEIRNSGSVVQGKTLSRLKKRIFTLILLILPLVFLLLMEGVLRLFNYGGSPDLFVLQTTGEQSEYVLNENFTKRYFFQKGIHTPVPLSQTFPAIKDSATLRIFCLGASTTQGFPYPPNGAYPALLQNILSSAMPKKKIQVLNCGITAITSHSLLDMEREILQKYQPDLLIIYTGHNEFYGVFGQASTLTLFRNRTLLQGFLRMQHSRLVLLLRNVINDLFGKTIGRGMQHESNTLMRIMAQDISIDYKGKVFLRTEDQYEKNLVELCVLAKKHHTDIMLCNLIDNEKDLPPFNSKHVSGFTEDTARWQESMQRAQDFQNTSQYKNAISEYKNALTLDSLYALTHYKLAQCYYALNEYENARTHFILSKDYDAIRFRAPSSFNKLIAQVAYEQHVPVIDVKRAFDERSTGRIPGQTLLYEHVHPNLQGYLLIAETIAEKMRETGTIPSFTELNLKESTGLKLALRNITALDLEVANYRIFRLMSQWPFPKINGEPVYRRIGNERTEELAREMVDRGKKSVVELHLEYGNEFHQQNELGQAIREYQAALAISPLDVTYNRLGRVYLRIAEMAFREQKDYNNALSAYQNSHYYFTEGLKRWPDHIEMNFNLGLLYLMRTDKADSAKIQMIKVIQLDDGHKNAYKLLAELTIRQHDDRTAKKYLMKAVQLFPDDAEFCTDLGVVFLHESNLSESERWLRKAIRLKDDAKAKIVLRQIQQRLKTEKN
jgi:lysophospholipase L1-like esterase/Flp pilus assembly protein TadD